MQIKLTEPQISLSQKSDTISEVTFSSPSLLSPLINPLQSTSETHPFLIFKIAPTLKEQVLSLTGQLRLFLATGLIVYSPDFL